MKIDSFLLAIGLSAGSASGQAITLVQISTPFNSPIGIDHHTPTNTVILSVNYSSGQPLNFERILADGTHLPFSSVSGFTDEVKIATIRDMLGGFEVGDLFVGNGVDGEIAKLSDDGATVVNPWVSLPGAGNGLMRGSLHHDRTGVFGHDLIVCTTSGEVWRIASDGTTSATPLASIGTHLEGLWTVPDNSARYGPLAGKIICGAEGQGLLYTIDVSGTVASFAVGVNVEDIELIEPNQNFLGINFGTNRVLGAPAAEFAGMTGDLLLTQESHAGSGLFRLQWNGQALVATQLGLTTSSETPGQWEHVCFSPAGITPLNGFPFFSAATPCGQSLPGSVGTPVQFNVEALDNDAGDVVTLDVTGLPPGSILTPGLPSQGNPVSSMFTFTPTNADVGVHMVVFEAVDVGGLRAECTIFIDVANPIRAACPGTGCPCGNDDPSAGCANGTGVGGLLTTSGTTSVVNDDLVFTASQLPVGPFGYLYMAANPDCAALGDGLRAGQPGPLGMPPGQGFLRFPVRSIVGGSFSEGPGLAAYAASQFGAPGAILAGSTFLFQGVYRDPMGSPCGSGFNLTQGLEVTFH